MNDKNNAPNARWVIGSILGGLLSVIMATAYQQNRIQAFIIGCGIALILSGIPMFIAYNRNIKLKEWVYWFAFFGAFLPFGTIWIIVAFVLAIFGKNGNKKSKKKTPEKRENKTLAKNILISEDSEIRMPTLSIEKWIVLTGVVSVIFACLYPPVALCSRKGCIFHSFENIFKKYSFYTIMWDRLVIELIVIIVALFGVWFVFRKPRKEK